MKEVILKYSLIVAISLLVIIFVFFTYKTRSLNGRVEVLQRELSEQKAKEIMAVDSVTRVLTEQMFRSLQVRDSLERERLYKLQDKQVQLIREYEKISTDYSSIVIDRPDF